MVLIFIQPYREPRDTLQRTIRDYKNHPNRDSRSFFVLSQVGNDVEATEFLETVRTDIDVADMIFCPQRLDDFYGSSQAACEVDKQYASYVSGSSMDILPLPDLYIWLLLTRSSSLEY
jgi:hypothetical protein